MSSDSKSNKNKHDMVLLHSRTEDGEGFRALRARPQKVEMAELRPLKEGKPLSSSSEILRLHPREESPLLFDVEESYRPDSEQYSDHHDGPARVTSNAYRRNWDAIFAPDSKPKTDKQMLN